MGNKFCIVICVILLFPLYLFAQEKQVRGIVKEAETNEPLPGVTILIENSTRGVTTDLDGTFELRANTSDKLIFSFLGLESQTVEVGNKTFFEISLRPQASELEEITVVGFGKQKKESVVASISTVKPSDLKVPSSNLTTALSGRLAGMISYQRSGEPGMDNADFFIRGVTTFGYKVDPLILIDNVEVTTTDMARLQVDDIESFSIMKDASATAIYGARGANGVILITTKEGVEGPAKVSVRVENAISSPARKVELADPITYMKLHNEAVITRDPLGVTPYSYQKIDNTIVGSGSLSYPSTDWQELLMKNQTMNQRVNLSVRGGGKVAQYFVSGAFNKDNGILNVDKRANFNNNVNLKTYSLRGNININLTKTTEMSVRLNGSFDDYIGPRNGGTQVYNDIMRTNPVLFPPYYPAGSRYQYINHIMFGNASGSKLYLNPYAEMMRGYKEYSRAMMLAQLEMRQDLKSITEGLNFRIMLNTTRNSYFDLTRQYNPFYYSYQGVGSKGPDDFLYYLINEDNGTEYLNYSEGDKSVSSVFYLESAIDYNRTFNDKHTVSGLLVYIMRSQLNGNAGSLELSLPFRNVGVSGRTTYAYDRRYFVEFNFGLNGSERFHKSQRFGFFPSFGLAWTISNEAFWEPMKDVVSNFRIRGTYGLVGNDAIGGPADRFFYLSNVNMQDGGRAAYFGTDHSYGHNGISIQRYPNEDITWETSYKSNLAIEMGLFEKTNIQVDLFKEKRKNILMGRSNIPTSMGLSSGVSANVGEASGKGIDLSIDHSQAFQNGSWLQSRINFTYATSKYDVYEEPQYKEPWLYRVGYPIRVNRGLIAERLFIDDQDVSNSPTQHFGEVRGGDIKYMDVNKDGQITDLDRVPIGYPTTPEINYGFGFSYGIKNLDLSVFFQGSARSSFWIDPSITAPFVERTRSDGLVTQTQLLKAYADDHWSESNQNIYALWPRLSETLINNNLQTSTWFMRDGSFLRFKQLEVGYSLPDKLSKKIKMSNFRLYASGTNLMVWSKFKLWDVEMAGNGLGYPIQRVYNLGIQLSF